MAGLKECTLCHEHKLPDFFSKRSARCKPCASDVSKRWREANRERYSAHMRSWRQRQGSAEKIEGYRIKYRYGLTTAQRDEMLAAQNGQCAICATSFDKAPHIDHCHTTGKIRGLLCDLCNRGLGYFKDSPEKLRVAAAYIEDAR